MHKPHLPFHLFVGLAAFVYWSLQVFVEGPEFIWGSIKHLALIQSSFLLFIGWYQSEPKFEPYPG